MSRRLGNRLYASRRDANESPLVRLATRLGAKFQQYGPLDFWMFRAGVWVPLEIKTVEGVYTPKQRIFLADCEAWGAPHLTWRDESDVLRDLGARVSA